MFVGPFTRCSGGLVNECINVNVDIGGKECCSNQKFIYFPLYRWVLGIQKGGVTQVAKASHGNPCTIICDPFNRDRKGKAMDYRLPPAFSTDRLCCSGDTNSE